MLLSYNTNSKRADVSQRAAPSNRACFRVYFCSRHCAILTAVSGSLKSELDFYACVLKLDLGLYSHPKEWGCRKTSYIHWSLAGAQTHSQKTSCIGSRRDILSATDALVINCPNLTGSSNVN
jgi:hypothetical protein